ncbi:hypothetical protein [Sphingomonas sp. SORGH_AS_0438]|uniref:hypothetical protein n=1 Tax=Sphingomonas sp. SORGH_AS_0438 TaxID=3041756 RepID=UPI0028581DE7|nr:hypothetical protein [Sphingomonas sp. SORGH_AS_0438]MDR6128026.1 hypothetical protein [Sphingomonas sp. SORGH_AS_0438]
MHYQKLSPSRLQKRLRRKVRQREKRHHRRQGQHRWAAARSKQSPKFIMITFPRELHLRRYIQRQAFLKACEIFRISYLQDRRDVLLDFSRTRKIQADAMLVLVAEIDRASRMGLNSQTIRCKLPNGGDEESKIVCQVFEQIELLHRIGQSPLPPKHHDDDYHETVRHWRYATGTRADETSGDVLDEHEGRVSPSLMQSVQTGLSEALVNILHHAYKADRNDGCKGYKERRWWMFTHERNGMLDVLICDLGIGISRSLPLTWEKNFLKKLQTYFPAQSADAAAINIALLLGESSTGDIHRGKGLPQIWNATRSSSAGGVGILSGKAYVGFDSASGRDINGSFKTSLLGTLINWTFPVDSTERTDG